MFLFDFHLFSSYSVIKNFTVSKVLENNKNNIQGVSEIGALILTGNRTHQKEQLFSPPFWRKTLRNGLKN
jgi:hypothetical protein